MNKEMHMNARETHAKHTPTLSILKCPHLCQDGNCPFDRDMKPVIEALLEAAKKALSCLNDDDSSWSNAVQVELVKAIAQAEGKS